MKTYKYVIIIGKVVTTGTMVVFVFIIIITFNNRWPGQYCVCKCRGKSTVIPDQKRVYKTSKYTWIPYLSISSIPYLTVFVLLTFYITPTEGGLRTSSHRTGQYGACNCRSRNTVTPERRQETQKTRHPETNNLQELHRSSTK